jgi:hypothetical protein
MIQTADDARIDSGIVEHRKRAGGCASGSLRNIVQFLGFGPRYQQKPANIEKMPCIRVGA